MLKRNLRLYCIFFAMVLLFSFFNFTVKSAPNEKDITILFTHDMHDHLMPFNVVQNGNIKSVGGYARLQSAINEERKNDSDLLLVDAGDFSMGTLFQTIFGSDAP